VDSRLSPYINHALMLKKKPRRGCGNAFRHQVETMAILLEFGYDDPVLLKAALLHDLLEDGPGVGFTAFEDIRGIDSDGAAVLELVKEVSRITTAEGHEPKAVFLERIMVHGSERAKALKMADRLSNIAGLSLANDQEFIRDYLLETEEHILPFAAPVNRSMTEELQRTIKFIKTNYLK
jgi:GTP pyrophosphokinase